MTLITTDSALIPIDMTNDFMHPKGTLRVEGAGVIIKVVNDLMMIFREKKAKIVGTRDGHPEGHISFASRYGVAPFTFYPEGSSNRVWPDHSILNTWGGEFVDGLGRELFNYLVTKGTDKDDLVDSYSGFAHTELDEYLKSQNIKRNFIAGVATDRCVKETAIDSIKNGYETYLVTDAVKAVDETTTAEVLKALEDIGVKLITSAELLQEA